MSTTFFSLRSVGTDAPEKVSSIDPDTASGNQTNANIILPSLPSHKLSQVRLRGATAHQQSNVLDVSPNTSDTELQKAYEDVGPLVRPSQEKITMRRFRVLQQWEGIVTDIHTDHLEVDLLDLTDPSKPREISNLPIDEIPEADHDVLLPGCVFYWIIGYETSAGGQKSRVSEIRIRRNPKWTDNEIDKIKARGQDLYQEFAGGAEDKLT